MPVVVYLDSQDYSRLSDPRAQTKNLSSIRKQLLEYSSTQKAIFVFSSPIISEMAPLSPQHANHAAVRAEFLSSLCRRNTFISIERILEKEFSSIGISPPKFDDLVSTIGDWFPTLGDIFAPIDLASNVRQEMKQSLPKSMNRKQRRATNSLAFRGTALRRAAIDHLPGPTNSQSFDEILAMYPMRPKECETIYKYILGKASKEQAELAFFESLRDPSWMMKWFANHSEKMNFVTQWFRQPSQTMLEAMQELVNKCKVIIDMESSLQIPKSQSFITRDSWIRNQDRMLESVAKPLISQFCPDTNRETSAAELDLYCPGFSTAFRVIHSSAWDSISRSARTPQSNDYLDSLHALHAPYVNLFRADRYMSTHIATHASRYGTKIVPSLDDLIPSIESSLIERIAHEA